MTKTSKVPTDGIDLTRIAPQTGLSTNGLLRASMASVSYSSLVDVSAKWAHFLH